MGRRGICYIDLRVVILLTAVAVLIVFTGISYWRWVKVTRVEFVSPELRSSWHISGQNEVKEIVRQVKASTGSGQEEKGSNNCRDMFRLRLFSRREVRVFTFSGEERIFDTKNRVMLNTSPGLKKILMEAVRELRIRSPYGELLSWNVVRELMPVEGEAEVTDPETGKTFSVRRTGGYSHADVIPVSKKDESVVRQIFGGEWTWKRRAVVVVTGGRKAAASMSGMPHRQGTTDGCFDLRFPPEKDNESGDNMSHRFMYYKAAGKLSELLGEASLPEFVLLLFTAIDQRDWQSMDIMLSPAAGIGGTKLEQVIGVTVYDIKEDKDNSACRMKVSVSFRAGPYNDKRDLTVRVRWDEGMGHYKADPGFLQELLRGI
ncbi:MAG: hypothetical protein CVU89_10035 [Firmicutes bacterium HGW-Firmicutes-14]|nr:MAG: hypothetical protein CVU89_10035 [Firmicutes bacterium HGW-Firmicutes-14]